MTSRALPIVALVVGAMFAASQLNHGWVPWDDGALAQSAQRVLLGALPHRELRSSTREGCRFSTPPYSLARGRKPLLARVPCSSSSSRTCRASLPDREAVRLPGGGDARGALRRRLGTPPVSRRDAVLVRLYLAVIGAYFLVKHHEPVVVRGLHGRPRRRALDLLQDHRRLVRAGRWCLPGVPRARNAGCLRRRADARSAAWRPGSSSLLPAVSALFVGAVLAEKLGAAEAVNLCCPSWASVPSRYGEGFVTAEASRRCAARRRVLAGVILPLVLLAVPYLLRATVGTSTRAVRAPRGRLETGYYGTARRLRSSSPSPTLGVLYAVGRRTRSARAADHRRVPSWLRCCSSRPRRSRLPGDYVARDDVASAGRRARGRRGADPTCRARRPG